MPQKLNPKKSFGWVFDEPRKVMIITDEISNTFGCAESVDVLIVKKSLWESNDELRLQLSQMLETNGNLILI